jgi:hypothetical protein
MQPGPLAPRRISMRLMTAALCSFTATVTLAACGSAAASYSAAPAVSPGARPSYALCQDPGMFVRLLVARTGPAVKAPGPGTVISDPSRVGRVARTLCEFPVQPAGVFNCPADFGIDDSLTFYAADRQSVRVLVDPSGCRLVTGLGGPARATATSPGLRTTLRQELTGTPFQ